jgi:hypothetical protein
MASQRFPTQTLKTIHSVYIQHFTEQFRIQANQEAEENDDFVLEDFQQDIMDEWSDERVDPPFVQDHHDFYLAVLDGIDNDIQSDEMKLFDLAMVWLAFEAVHDQLWIRCSCGRVEIVENANITLCQSCSEVSVSQ